jgi:two-component system LytT family response regulator
MNRIKTILVDDEPRGLVSLQKLLQLNCPEAEVIACCNSAEEARDAILQLDPQVVFLDIVMPGSTGLDMLRNLEKINFEIIFVTAHNNYMTQAFQFSAIDYLLKPVEEELLVQAIKRAGKRIEEKNSGQRIETLMYNIGSKNNSQKMKLCIPSLKGFQVIEIQDIIYCEASGNYTSFHFSNHPLVCASKPIHEYEELLSDCNFVRIHKSFLVNLEHVKEYVRGEGGSVIFSNGHEVEVSRRKKDLLMTRMKEFYRF